MLAALNDNKFKVILGGLMVPQADEIDGVETSATIETYTYKLSGLTVGTVTITYATSEKKMITKAQTVFPGI